MQNPLLVIDDVPLRQQSYRSAEKILKQIDRLEESLASFQDKDQKLFTQWLDQTFGRERQKLDQLQGEWRDLAQFHNWVVAAADMEHLPLFEAYRLVQAEQRAYEKGDERTRARIDRVRAQRESYVEMEVERESTQSRRKHSVYEQELFTRLWQMDDDEMAAVCADEDVAFEMLALSLRLSASPEDNELFLRVWEAVPEKHQAEMGRAFQHKFGVDLDQAIAAMRDGLEPQPSAQPEPPPESRELLKNLYRRLVRRLHPDAHRETAAWRQRLWLRAQDAYRSENVHEIEKLLRVTILREKRLHDLSLSEIEESCRWLEHDLLQLKSETKSLRRQPAWNFSRGRKNLATLSQRLRGDFERDALALEMRIVQIRREHARLEKLAKQSR